jgi:chromosome segregation protein
MRLSRLHLNGFKSFPDRAELGFDHGVTAIVGPNGCGKSNVVDAITWVLGEQSAKSLRGERMEDVIFNGSDARKPTAAAEVRLKLTEVAQAAMAAAAEVDALLDGQPLITRDVEIGRRLYRSGESEYLIDGEVCRLRDVHDLLMDSGLGIKAYAVIEQGKIGQILSSRPVERRALIEEAAGVTKYKTRRRAAELKLEAAQQNLTRIDDIIFEVEKQRGALRRQAARARRYRRLREELRRWEQVQFARRHEALSEAIETADTRLADARAREAASAGQVAELEAALEKVRLELTEAEANATATREEAHGRELEIGRAEQQRQFDRQQIEELARQADAFGLESRDLEGRRDPARLAIETQRTAAREAREALDLTGRRVAESEARYTRALLSVQAAEQEADGLRATVLASTTTLAALRQARDNAAAVRDRVAAEREKLDRELAELQATAERGRVGLDLARRAVGEARERLEALRRERTAAETELAARRRERDEQTAALGASQRELAAREARLRSLEELEAGRATFGDAARLLLGEPGRALGRRGAVADHLDVERSFERAVDALLGDLLQHVIVDRAEDVTRALAVVADQNAGRCGFVVLEDAKEPAPADPPLVVPPGARALSSVVRAKGPHAAVISRLLGRALIVDTFDTARALARAVSVPVASRSGEVFRGAWLVQGGSRTDVRGILESRAEVASLREEVRAADRAARTIEAGLEALGAHLADVEADVAHLVGEQHEQEKAIVGLEAQAGRAADEQARTTLRLGVVATERNRAREEERGTSERRDEAVQVITAHEAGQRDAERRLDGVLARLQASRDEAEGLLRLLTESRAEQAGLTERAAALEAEVARLADAANDLDERIAARRLDVRRTETRREELRASIRDTERRLDEHVAALDALRRRIGELDGRVAALRAEFGLKEHDIRDARQALEVVRAELMQSEVARATAASDLAHLASACLEAVDVPLDDVVRAVAAMEEAGELVAPGRRIAAASTADADEEGETAEGDAETPSAVGEAGAAATDLGTVAADAPLTPEEVIGDLKRRVERLGPVNMMAIEQFDELESRHTFLATQRKDLLDSIAQTGEAIRKIDKTTRERFEEAFVSINAHFQTTFATLVGGGRAGLILIDQENDPESGVDIIAQPPGKRLQNVQLLSGGEKALTAMALMFAIFKHRPSPFCLLDEIDAPLDDANIGRFVEMLQGMQAHTQFILITHNRKTMEIADRLYGVTMEEPGVSKLISVQLN